MSLTLLFQFIVGITVMILIHEMGHYLAARLVNIEVEEFGIGFPPRAAELFTYKGTKFTLNWIPLGGFIRPKGENDPEIEGGLAAAKPWARIFVLLAGPSANLLTAVILFAIIFSRIGAPDESQVIIREVTSDSPAEMAGLQPDDLIQSVNGVPIDNMSVLISEIQSNLDNSVEIDVLRSAQVITISAIPSSLRSPEEGALGIRMGNPTIQLNAFESISAGSIAVYRYVNIILSLPGRMISGTVDTEQTRFVGYVGMFNILEDMNARDAEAPPEIAGINTLSFFASITVSLGLFNLLPIPALDGGRILFVLPEIIFRRRVPANLENTVHLVGFAFLLMLLIYINLQDILNPFTIPPN